VFCLNDYVCWSAPEDDLSDWRYEGVIYKKTDDPLNPDGRMCLYAPDVTVGPDGRYYLYYVLDKVSVVSVAVCDSPAGTYEFYGYVHYPDGVRLGDREGDPHQFDPGVLTEGDITYMYTGFCNKDDESAKGSIATVLGADMLTVIEESVVVVPSGYCGKNTPFEGHEFFEASSIRKFGDIYYFIYSSVQMNELCYATSRYPTRDFQYGGVIVSNCDLNIDSYKPAMQQSYPNGNNHGSIIKIGEQCYVFYHRQTNGTWFSRQGCIEKIQINDDASIDQVEMTSLGGNGKPLVGKGEYPAYIACNLYLGQDTGTGVQNPKIMQDGRDGDEEPGYVANITNSTIIGFKYFECQDIKKITIKTRGYCNGIFEVKLSPEGKSLGSIPVEFTNIWTEFSSDIAVPNGVHAIYFHYKGGGNAAFLSFTLE
jgi:hypothetical protein